MANLKLDKTKPFGTIYGNHFASFEQDEKFFDADGNEIVDTSSTQQPASNPEPDPEPKK